MIWFSCTKCDQTLQRPDTSAGVLVFCDCGQGNFVPWESTRPAPRQPDPAVELPAEPPPLRAVPVAEEQELAAAAEHTDEAHDAQALALSRDPQTCFNHQDRPLQAACNDCGESFCANCLIKFQGSSVCGPCKNFRLRKSIKPHAMSVKAIFGVILALGCSPVVMCLLPARGNDASVIIGALGLVGQIVAVMLGSIALYETDKDPHLAGRPLAITTVLTGGLASLITIYFLIGHG